MLLARHADNALYRSQHGRMKRLIELGDPRIGTIDGQKVLDQIIRADSEKIHLTRQEISRGGGRRHLEGQADGSFGAEFKAIASQPLTNLAD
jgi:hypothetical protein